MGNVLGHAQMNDASWAAHLHAIYEIIAGLCKFTVKGFNRLWRDFRNWISQPHIRWRFICGNTVLIFALIIFGVPALGFGAGGITAGSWAAGFQGATYAAFTPAGGWFAWLTSMAMMGRIPWLAVEGGTAWRGRFCTSENTRRMSFSEIFGSLHDSAYCAEVFISGR